MNNGLRILQIVVAVALALLCGRIEYLQRWEAFHGREASRYIEMIATQRNVTPLEVDAALEIAGTDPWDDRLDYKFHCVFHHRSAANVYHQAANHPWRVVHQEPPPRQDYDE